jgi:type I restriction enzyme, S subunit
MRDGWEIVPLSRIASQSKERVRLESGRTYRTVGVLRDGRGLFDREPFVGGRTTYRELTPIREGQLVLRSITAWEAPVGMATEAHNGSHVSGVFPVFDLDHSRVLPDYMALVCQHQAFWEEMRVRTTGTVLRRKTLSASGLLSIPMSLPPLAEQRRIADLIGALDHAGSAYGRLRSASARARVSVMADFFASNAGPERRLGDVATVAQGSSLPVALQGSQTGSVPWYKVKDMASLGNDWGYRRAETMIDTSTIERHGGRIWPVGTVVFPRVGAAVATEKKRRIEVAGACDENHLVVVPGPDLDSGYLLAALENLRLASLVRSEAYPSLNQRIVGDIPLILPDLKTQSALAHTLQALRSVERASAVAVATAAAVRGAFLEALLSGASTLPRTYDRFLDGAA